jgi:hypothetical protein
MRKEEKKDATHLIQNRVVCVVGHVVRCDRREAVTLERKDSALEQHEVFVREQLVTDRERGRARVAVGKQALEVHKSGSSD